jgi:hypothetical protein
MPDNENSTSVLSGLDAFELLSVKVEELKRAGNRLLDAMEEQIEAIISSDSETMIRTTEQNVDEQQNFFKAEKELIGALARCNPNDRANSKAISFERLKLYFPGWKQQLEAWKQEISDQIGVLQAKQGQLVELLEFAQSRNSDMLRSLYELQNARHMHYRNNGKKSAPVSGITINQEG